MFAPPIVNKDYFLFEFGFVTAKRFKKYDYNYNAYVSAALFQDWLGQKDNLKAGGLGFKGGVIMPFQPWFPLVLTLSTGFAKTALHKKPFLGHEDGNVASKDMVLLEAGLMYRYHNYFLRSVYQISNVKYFNRHFILMLGVSY